MKKFRIVFSGILLLFLTVCAKSIFPQSDNRVSIQNKILSEHLPTPVAYSALAPESIFPTITENIFHPEMDRLLQIVTSKQSFIEEKSIKDKSINSSSSKVTMNQNRRNVSINRKGTKIANHSVNIEKDQGIKKPVVLSLISHQSLQGTINTLPYERIKNVGVRFRYTMIPEEMIGHFWRFHPVDLRGKVIRIYYSGIVPNEITFLFSRSYFGAKVSHQIFLKDSPDTQMISFSIPKVFAFKDISIFEFRIKKSNAGKSYGDFLIQKVEVGSEADNPDKMENYSHAFTFGGPYLQSNIWGGEALTS